MKMITGKTLFILVLLLLKSSEQMEQEDDDYKPEEEEYIEEENAETNLPDHENWMKTLDNNKLISDITIPGTHDALALYGGPMAQCQECSLDKQLKAGIRYLDLRVSGHKLKIMHGIVYQRTSLSDVLKTIKTFLKNSNTEFVLVRIKPVFPLKGKVQNLVEDLIKNDQNIYKSSKIPQIGDVRGKIVLVQKNTFKMGIILKETDKKGDYKVTKLTDKQNKIKKHLEEANDHCKSHALSLVYSSGTSLGTYMGFCLLPKELAAAINPWLKTHLEEQYKKNPKPCFGIIVMDFPTADLIEIIIKFNT